MMHTLHVMKQISPTSPLLTLIVTPQGTQTTTDLLAQFHPIMKSLGFAHFEMETAGFYQASKDGKGVFNNAKFVFAEVQENALVINIDGHSIFGLKGVEQQLEKIKLHYDGLGAQTHITGPNYISALLGTVLYTALPIYASAAMIAAIMVALGDFRKSYIINIFLYASLGIVGAKTRFWINQRQKQRPLWKSIGILLFSAPFILALVVLVFWMFDHFS